MPVRTRRTLFLTLFAIFLAQTWMVYSDSSGRRIPELSPRAAEGQALWLSRNCQACHQVFGFGGFLGPDLTNVASRSLSQQDADAGDEEKARALAERFEGTLTTGSSRMPAFGLSPEERVQLAAFFLELDRRGTGQASVGEQEAPRDLLARLVDRQLGTGERALTPLEAAGRAIVVQRGCIDCHLPNARSAFRAPDLAALPTRVDAARLAEVLRDGIPAKGMPPFGLSADDAEAVRAFLTWCSASRPSISDGFAAAERASSGSLADLPWFEYP